MEIFRIPRGATRKYAVLVLISLSPSFIISIITHAVNFDNPYSAFYACFSFFLFFVSLIGINAFLYPIYDHEGVKLSHCEEIKPKILYTILMFLPAIHFNFTTFSDVSFGVFIFICYYCILFMNEKFLYNHILYLLDFRFYSIKMQNPYKNDFTVAISFIEHVSTRFIIKTDKVTNTIALTENDI